MGKKNEIGKKVKCDHCKYIWLTKSKKIITCCPRCSYRVRIEKSLTHESINNFKPDIIKKSVYGLIRNKLKNGEIVKPDHCELCYKKNVDLESHHNDYTRPLNIIWLCKICHRNVDQNKISILDIYNINLISTSVKLNSLNVFEMLYFRAL